MSLRVAKAPSPVRSGLVHTGLSVLVFAGIALAAAAAIHLSGMSDSASPARQIALFEPATPQRPALKARFASGETPPGPLTPAPTEARADAAPEPARQGQNPSLNVAYPGDTGPGATQGGGASGPDETVRINGVSVSAGRSWKETQKRKALPPAPISAVSERTPLGTLPVIAGDGRTPAGVYARPFANPEDRPQVAIVLGGLGINWRHTNSAIEELPPEVTLSFAPTAPDLQGWIDKARAAGHEVLLEVPMEPYDFGRERAHSHTLFGEHDDARTEERLEYLLSRATGYFGITNYQGSKFATDADSTRHLATTLEARGVALVEDGSLSRSTFAAAADETGLRFRKANTPIDSRPEGEEIETRLLELEALALENGSSLGTGFAYPVTIDILKEWTDGLAGKGLVLAPASSVTRASAKEPDAVNTAGLDAAQGGQTGG